MERNANAGYADIVNTPPVSYYFFKRLLDIIGAIIGILSSIPVCLIIIILIKLDSPGPALFAHERYGKSGKLIKVYKFRSMYKNAEDMMKKFTTQQRKEFNENFKLKNDPRITRVGKVLRRTSLDELPQLINILSGNMSIVGPRPIVVEEIEKYGVHADKFLSVKPGLTGLWQICGRSTTTYDERVALDIKYIDTRTLIGDICIFLKTFLVVWKKFGAY